MQGQRGRRGVVTAALVVALSGLAWGAPKPVRQMLWKVKEKLPVHGYLRLADGPGGKPYYYVEMTRDTLRAAARPQDLGRARPLHSTLDSVTEEDFDPKSGVRENEERIFPAFSVPPPSRDVQSVQVTLRLYRALSSKENTLRAYSVSVMGDVCVTQRDAAGVPWQFRSPIGSSLAESSSRGKFTVVRRRVDLANLELGLRPNWEYQGLALSPRVAETAGGYVRVLWQVRDARGQPPRVEFVVRDPAGQVVHRGQVPLEQSVYHVKGLPRGNYKVTATLLGIARKKPIRAQVSISPPPGHGRGARGGVRAPRGDRG